MTWGMSHGLDVGQVASWPSIQWQLTPTRNGRVSASEASLHASYGAISVLTSAADTINRAKKAGIVT